MLNKTILLYFVFCIFYSFLHSQSKDYTGLFKDTTYKNYWYRYSALKGLCKEVDKNYKTILLAYEHKEVPVSELALECLTKLQNKKNIDDYIKKYVDGENDLGKLKKSLAVLSKLSKEKLLNIFRNSKDKSIKLVILDYLYNEQLEESDLKLISDEYSKNNSKDVKLSILKIFAKYDYIKEADKYLKTQDKSIRIYGLYGLCSQDKERCENKLSEEVFSNLAKDTEYFCQLISIVKRYKVTGVLSKLLDRIDKMGEYIRKKMIFSALPILSEGDFKEVVLHYWKELTVNFLSLLVNVYSLKFNVESENLSLEDIYKNLRSDDNKGEFKTSGIPTFFTMPVYGKNIVFIIDMSGSMARKVKSQVSKGKSDDKTRFEVAREELRKVLNKLGVNVKFNIILINSDTDKLGIRFFSKNLVSANKNEIKEAVEYLNKAWEKLQEVKRGRTDIYDALEMALNMSNIDTVVLLTDGNPTWGKYTLPENIVNSINKLNECKFVSINSVAVDPTRKGLEFLRKLSLNNFGIARRASFDTENE